MDINQIIYKNIPNYDKYIESGVVIENPLHTYIEFDVIIGKNTVILAGSRISKKSIIGDNCIIGPDARIEETIIKNNITIKDSTIIKSFVDDNSNIGPYAYIRPNSKIGKNVKIGDFVEIKNSLIDDNTKVSHLTYVGDSDIGKNVNLGCGVVFVNYDGVNKYRSLVKDNAFIGCNVNLISPVEIGENSYIAAGSTITKNVPDNGLAICRNREQKFIKNWTKKQK